MNNESSLPDGASHVIDFVKWLLYIVVILGMLGAITGGGQLLRARYNRFPESQTKGAAVLLSSITLSLSAGVVAMVVLPAYDSNNDEAAAATPPSEIPTTDIAPAAAPASTSPTEPTDWTPLIWIGGVLGALVIAALAVHLVVRTRHRILDRRAAAQTLAADFEAAKIVYAQVASAYAEYLADPYAIFTRPQLDNLGEPRTATFITAFNNAGALNTDTCPASAERVQAFGAAAQTALTAWNTADQYARAVGMGEQTEESKRTVRRIRSALELALDNTAAAGEREAAMTTVRRLSDGLLTVPDRVYAHAKTAIESVTRKQLTS
ncbi:hypothetical protein CH253_17910 [Rhodococcus sp. 06-156-3C]|uniref:hypothetical protein n=1 Tax=Nocardiaceae TaxID=85025 RepID=UPI0005230002|nr:MULTISPECIES: hypothetical protein [Rhodococcus]OZD18335.1 hypothetical protein CH280_07235 [Rhodococcus sp. 06-156-4C]OZD18933.1 hypothetical protein CH253_17910 [Rhodococcus sp. 06-156-3C]OZD22443.1 hypothetical protein CH248_09495 [Rhodococcus sp. 06-156-4a]OZD34027.1 hypothetical protein CH247_08025 [Rhodococcus sp. 06-156-3b]OZD38764.1 hypothetical protein CH284_06445 [Rhodococcus sp. 06-156-3]